MGRVPDRTPAGVPEEAEPEDKPIDDSIGFIPTLLPERRGTANRFPGIALRSIPWLCSDAPSALKDLNRELLPFLIFDFQPLANSGFTFFRLNTGTGGNVTVRPSTRQSSTKLVEFGTFSIGFP